ncbi:3-oxoadipate enol-lactonase [Agromyces luteolus]|uniref:Alpha/beta fold hydrolase n=1 Tax=Agromyces luteolus TaxID=88373 RepID=A0A7C9LGB6_9MICO|nr:alpha/beta fold hydrolase [Agromyces luteolus]MUN08610.1 alpha/beta fold hydrolase [Agromyces luteolus]GLK27150.1 3-oxoadipate enol-lactonase [Agromyces luteolus]
MSDLGWLDDPQALEAEHVIVLLPSLGTTVRIFDELVDGLTGRWRDLAVLRADLPGHGIAPRAYEVSIPSLGAEVSAVVRMLRARHVTVAGVSMGGAIALEAATHRPPDLDSFVMINSGTSFGTPDGWRTLIANVTEAGVAATALGAKAGWFSPDFAESARAQALLEDLSRIDSSSYVACCRALADYHGPADLGQLDVPALLIATSDDTATPPTGLRALARRLRHARFVELPSGGHLSLVEHSHAVEAILADAIQKGRTNDS